MSDTHIASKIIHDLSDFPEVPMERRFFHYSCRANNTLSIVPYSCHTTQFLNSYFPRTAAQCSGIGIHYQQMWRPGDPKLNCLIQTCSHRTHNLGYMYYMAIHVSPAYYKQKVIIVNHNFMQQRYMSLYKSIRIKSPLMIIHTHYNAMYSLSFH